MSTVAELLAQKAELDKQIAELQREERASAIAQVKALMAQHGLSITDLTLRAAASRPGEKPRSNAGVKVAAKYRDPATGNTWSGRGLKPNWLKAALEGGKSLSDFAVQGG